MILAERSDSLPAAVWPVALKHEAYALSVQGHTTRQIAAILLEKHGRAEAPSSATVQRWLSEPEAQPVIDSIRKRVAANVAIRADEMLDSVFDTIAQKLVEGDLRQVDAGSRAIVNLTRGIVADRVELEPPKAVGGDQELRALLAAHGVNLASSDNPPVNTP